MNSAEIKHMQQRIRDRFDSSLKVDGEWGNISRRACQEYLRSLMPKVSPWPKPDATSLVRFYGQPGDENNLVTVEFPFPTFYGGKSVTKTRCHKKVAASLLRVLTAIGSNFGKDPGIMEEITDYGGCFNFRPKRGGSSWSLHAFGAAIDYDDDQNTFQQHWPQQADMPLEIMEEFAKEGWKSGGAFWGYDAMHFECTA